MTGESETLFSAMQMAVSPVILISACGLLLLSMSNRLGRVIDRARLLGREDQASRQVQIAILRKRVRLIRAAIFLNVLCILFTALIVLSIFVELWLKISLDHLVVIFFALALTSLIGSVIYFIVDVSHSLDAMEADMKGL